MSLEGEGGGGGGDAGDSLFYFYACACVCACAFFFLVFVLQSDRIYNINSCPSVLNLPHRPRLLPMGAGDGGSEWQGERGSGDEVVTQK